MNSSVKMSACYSKEVKKASTTMLGRGGKREKPIRLLPESMKILKTVCCGQPHQKEDRAELGKKMRAGTRISARFFI